MYSVFVFCVSQFFVLVLSLLCCLVFIVCMNMMLSYMEEIKNLSIYLSVFHSISIPKFVWFDSYVPVINSFYSYRDGPASVEPVLSSG